MTVEENRLGSSADHSSSERGRMNKKPRQEGKGEREKELDGGRKEKMCGEI